MIASTWEQLYFGIVHSIASDMVPDLSFLRDRLTPYFHQRKLTVRRLSSHLIESKQMDKWNEAIKQLLRSFDVPIEYEPTEILPDLAYFVHPLKYLVREAFCTGSVPMRELSESTRITAAQAHVRVLGVKYGYMPSRALIEFIVTTANEIEACVTPLYLDRICDDSIVRACAIAIRTEYDRINSAEAEADIMADAHDLDALMFDGEAGNVGIDDLFAGDGEAGNVGIDDLFAGNDGVYEFRVGDARNAVADSDSDSDSDVIVILM
jgi:hypothetical protein